MFSICSHVPMSRLDDDMLALHLEVALATASPALIDGLANSDRRRRHMAIGEIARQLVERLRGFDIGGEKGRLAGQSSLFPEDLGPIG